MPTLSRWKACAIGLLAGLLLLVGEPPAANAAPTALLTVNKTEFKAGDTLSIGVDVANPANGPHATFYLGIVMPDGETALFLAPNGTTPPVSLADAENFRSLQPAPPGFALSVPVFSQFTWPADGFP